MSSNPQDAAIIKAVAKATETLISSGANPGTIRIVVHRRKQVGETSRYGYGLTATATKIVNASEYIIAE